MQVHLAAVAALEPVRQFTREGQSASIAFGRQDVANVPAAGCANITLLAGGFLFPAKLAHIGI